MSEQNRNTAAWTVYGQRQLDHGHMPPVPETITWGPWKGVGPGTEILGDVYGRRVRGVCRIRRTRAIVSQWQGQPTHRRQCNRVIQRSSCS
ncbi:hypothetical protein [Streptomyces sp. UG1]|uniref:hypothetical protein n=1 Tax=Streptomyces sp. UG1 TaxID=3417652 RepID=UPI003CF02A1A